MYKVYLVIFKEQNSIYVGCTNNIRRRKDQHNANARNRNGKFGSFLNDNKLTLNECDLIIIKEIAERSAALKLERNTVFSFNKSDVNVLNDNYSLVCSRKGKLAKELSNAEEWVLIDLKEKSVTETFSLRKYCLDNNLSYKNIHSTSHGKSHLSLNRYKAFKKTVWQQLSDVEKQHFISGDFLKEIETNIKENHLKVASKSYIVKFPDGHEELITNLDKFARDHKINDGNLHASIKNGRHASGYIARKPN